ncbi:MAG: FecR domain-containing protein [Myxococcales bacterium]|nr:FecR domain-containing protein [Myxococcales bacterium]
MTNRISSHEMEHREFSLQKRLVPWEDTTPQERALLLDVEQELLGAFASKKKKAVAPKRSMHLAFGMAASCCAVLLAWLSWPRSEGLAPLQIQGGWQRSNTKPISSKATALQAPLREKSLQTRDDEGSVQQGETWQLRAKKQTTLRLTRRHNLNTEVQLTKGHIQVHVKPHTMERFAVFCQGGVQVLVRGTVFSVEQRADWVRVEVTRGKVVVQRGKEKRNLLLAGQGERVDLGSGEVVRYPLPPAALKSPVSKLVWYAEHAPKHLFAYVLDRSGDPNLLANERDALFRRSHAALRRLARQAKGKSYLHQAYALLLAEYRSNPPHGAAELSLLSAMQMCRRLFDGGAPCIRWYRHYLKQYQQGIQREQVLYWLVETLAHRGKAERAEAKGWVERYLQSHQKGDSFYAHFSGLKQKLQAP